MEKRESPIKTPLIINSNILIACLKSKGLTRQILFSKQLKRIFNVFLLDFCFDEIWKYRSRWNTQNLSDNDLLTLLDFLFKERIQIYPSNKIQDKIAEALNIMKNIDQKDTPILALALHVQGIIWSYDNHLKEQVKIKCLTTNELKILLKL
jgi:predicted nucleic acid-binding protein